MRFFSLVPAEQRRLLPEWTGARDRETGVRKGKGKRDGNWKSRSIPGIGVNQGLRREEQRYQPSTLSSSTDDEDVFCAAPSSTPFHHLLISLFSSVSQYKENVQREMRSL